MLTFEQERLDMLIATHVMRHKTSGRAYSSNLLVAWDIVDHMRDMRVEKLQTWFEFLNQIEGPGGIESIFTMSSPELATVICKAALKATGVTRG